jgi:hypothetical protein
MVAMGRQALSRRGDRVVGKVAEDQLHFESVNPTRVAVTTTHEHHVSVFDGRGHPNIWYVNQVDMLTPIFMELTSILPCEDRQYIAQLQLYPSLHGSLHTFQEKTWDPI